MRLGITSLGGRVQPVYMLPRTCVYKPIGSGLLMLLMAPASGYLAEAIMARPSLTPNMEVAPEIAYRTSVPPVTLSICRTLSPGGYR
jgi:hypothetical protein